MAERSQESRTALSAGVGSAAAVGTTVASGLLGNALSKGLEGKTVPVEEIKRLARAMGFPHGTPAVVWGSQAPAWTGSWVELPGGTPFQPNVSLPQAGHELGHAKGGLLQKAFGAVSRALFSRPGGVSLSPLHAPLMVAAATPKSGDKRVRWLQEHPAEIAASLAAIPLLQEAHASARALKGIKEISGGWKPALQSAGPLSRGLLTHTLSHVPAIAAIWVTSRIRDWLQEREEGKMEKRGSERIRSMVHLSFSSFRKN